MDEWKFFNVLNIYVFYQYYLLYHYYYFNLIKVTHFHIIIDVGVPIFGIFLLKHYGTCHGYDFAMLCRKVWRAPTLRSGGL